MSLLQDIKKKATQVNFVSTGISNPDMLHGLPHGWISTVSFLRTPEEELPKAKSVIILGLYAWDRAFNLTVDSSYLKGRKTSKPVEPSESYQLYYEVMRGKAWLIVDYLSKRGFDSLVSFSIPLKTSAVRCGLGCQGKNTLLITPRYGPRVRLVSVITTAELETDEPYKEDLCRDCRRCLVACPTKALTPHKLTINRCMTYAAERPDAEDVSSDVRKLERRLIERPTPNSYIECSRCIDVCPIGETQRG
nr:4Fe-4S double cluster binding domain-containing protein [Candidatus Njordarchaeota archaeon]